jgi:glycosyltransferase involved in cell wall biosynthesis
VEVILIDDGSKDKSYKIAKKYYFKIIKQNHLGPGVARNRGARMARGKILCFLDADMKYDKNYIEKLISPVLKGKAVGAFNYELVANKDNIWSTCFSINSDLSPGERTHQKDVKESDIFRAILKSEFKKSGGFNSELGYVDDKSIAVALGKKSVFAKDAISYHYNPESLSEVFFSSRWIGRSLYYPRNLENFLRFSFFNSIRNSIKKISKGAPLEFILFKLTYDFGLIVGMFTNKENAK